MFQASSKKPMGAGSTGGGASKESPSPDALNTHTSGAPLLPPTTSTGLSALHCFFKQVAGHPNIPLFILLYHASKPHKQQNNMREASSRACLRRSEVDGVYQSEGQLKIIEHHCNSSQHTHTHTHTLHLLAISSGPGPPELLMIRGLGGQR